MTRTTIEAVFILVIVLGGCENPRVNTSMSVSFASINHAWKPILWVDSGRAIDKKFLLLIYAYPTYWLLGWKEEFHIDAVVHCGRLTAISIDSIEVTYGSASVTLSLHCTESLTIIGSYLNAAFPGMLDHNSSIVLGELEDMICILYIMLGKADFWVKQAAWTIYSKRLLAGNSDLMLIINTAMSAMLQQSPIEILDNGGVIDINHTQSLSDLFDSISTACSTMSNTLRSQAFRRISSIICVMALAYTASRSTEWNLAGVKSVIEGICTRDFGRTQDVIVSVSDALAWLFSTGKEIYEKGWYFVTYDDLRALEVKLDFIDNCIEHVDALDTYLVPQQFHTIIGGRPKTNIYELDQLSEIVGIEVNNLSSQVFTDKFVKNRVNDLAKRVASVKQLLLRKRLSQSERKSPFSVLVFGTSGIGKSSITSMIRRIFCNVTHLSSDESYVYSMSPSAKYWDGYRSSCHTILMDDMATIRPESKLDDAISPAILRVINNMPFMPDQASLENKGTQPCLARLVVGTTNTKDLNAFAQFSNPAAVLRRFPLVVIPTLKAEFKGPDGKFRNPSHELWPDAWTFDIEEVSVVPGVPKDQPAWRQVAHFDDLRSFSQFMVSKIKEHERDQDIYMRSRNGIVNSVGCSECNLPLCLCHCTQSLDLYLPLGLFAVSFLCVRYFRTAIASFIGIVEDKIDSCVSYVIGYVANRTRIRCVRAIYCWWFHSKMLMQRNRNTLVVTGAIALALFILSTYKSTRTALQFAQARPLQEVVVPGNNPWYKEEPVPLSNQSKCTNGPSEIQRREKLCHNSVVMLMLSINGRTSQAHGLRLKPGVVLVNKHALTKDSTLPETVNASMFGYAASGQKLLVSDVTCVVKEIPDRDVVALCSAGLGTSQDITQLFLLSDTTLHMRVSQVRVLSRDDTQSQRATPGEVTLMQQACSTQAVPSYTYYGVQTDKGDSGRPVWVTFESGGAAIVGLHSARLPKELGDFGVAAVLTQSMLDKIPSSFPKMSCLDSHAQAFDIDEPHPKSPFSLQSQSEKSIKENFPYGIGNIEYLGSLVLKSGARFPTKTLVSKVAYRDFADDFASVGEKYGLRLQHVRPDLDRGAHCKWKPVVHFLKGIHRARATVRLDVLESVKAKVLKRFKVTNPHVMHVLTDEDTINGLKGSYVERMKVQTSAGFPHMVPKARLMNYNSETDKWSFGPLLEREKLEAEANLVEGRRSGLIFSASRKDEPRKLETLKEKGPRLFFCGNVTQNFLLRKYFMSIVRLFIMDNEKYCSSIGMNVESHAWTKLYNRLIKFGRNRIMAGDYTNYDSTMNVQFILAAWEIILALIKPFYTEEEYKIAETLAMEMIHPMYEIDGDLIIAFGTNPSGHALTTHINCIVNLLYLMYAFEIANPGFDFFEHVELTTYGDDNIMAISERVNFDYLVVASELEKIGVIYTRADKTKVTAGLDNIDDCTFLKRGFRVEGQRVLAPLALESVFRSTQIGVHTPYTTRQAVVEGIHNNAMCLPEDVRADFHAVTQKLSEIVLPSYEDFLKRYDENSITTAVDLFDFSQCEDVVIKINFSGKTDRDYECGSLYTKVGKQKLYFRVRSVVSIFRSNGAVKFYPKVSEHLIAVLVEKHNQHVPQQMRDELVKFIKARV